MAFIDVFNGDADGLCALIQLRLASPQDSELVSGVTVSYTHLTLPTSDLV